jgi:hypothetical protein
VESADDQRSKRGYELAKLKHKQRSQPRRPADRRKSLAKQRIAAAVAQNKLERWLHQGQR